MDDKGRTLQSGDAPYWYFAGGAILVVTLAAMPLLRNRERRDESEPPPPGVLRARAERLGQVPPPPPPVLPPPPRKSPTERLVSGEGVSTEELEEARGPQPPFNWWALVGLLVPLIMGFGSFLLWSGTTNRDDPDRVGPPAIEMLLSGGVGLWFSIIALRRARDGRLRGRGLAVAAIIVSAIILLLGFGALGTYVNDAAMAAIPAICAHA